MSIENIAYRFAGNLLGFLIAPLSLAGLGLPYYLKLDAATQKLIGLAFLGLAVVAVLCNFYLRFYKVITGVGKGTFFPVVVSLCGVPALFLLWKERTPELIYGAVGAIVLFDLVGQAVIAKMLCGKRKEN